MATPTRVRQLIGGVWRYVTADEDAGGGSQTVYVQDDDPGAVGAGMIWIDTSTTPFTLKIRTAADDDWGASIELTGRLVTKGWDVRGYEDSNAARLALGATPGGAAQIVGSNNVATGSGGSASIEAGSGDGGNTSGAYVIATPGDGDGVTHGRIQVQTNGVDGTAGQVLMSDGAHGVVWADLP